MPVLTRRRTKSDSIGPSGSEYNASEPSTAAPERDGDAESDEQPVVFTTSKRGRRVKQASYRESEDEIDGLNGAENLFDDHIKVEEHQAADGDKKEDKGHSPRRRSVRCSTQNLSKFVIEDKEEEPEDSVGYALRR